MVSYSSGRAYCKNCGWITIKEIVLVKTSKRVTVYCGRCGYAHVRVHQKAEAKNRNRMSFMMAVKHLTVKYRVPVYVRR